MRKDILEAADALSGLSTDALFLRIVSGMASPGFGMILEVYLHEAVAAHTVLCRRFGLDPDTIWSMGRQRDVDKAKVRWVVPFLALMVRMDEDLGESRRLTKDREGSGLEAALAAIVRFWLQDHPDLPDDLDYDRFTVSGASLWDRIGEDSS